MGVGVSVGARVGRDGSCRYCKYEYHFNKACKIPNALSVYVEAINLIGGQVSCVYAEKGRNLGYKILFALPLNKALSHSLFI